MSGRFKVVLFLHKGRKQFRIKFIYPNISCLFICILPCDASSVSISMRPGLQKLLDEILQFVVAELRSDGHDGPF